MRGCQLAEDGDRLTITPGVRTRLAPLTLGVVLGGALLYGAALALDAPAGNLAALAAEPAVWFYTALGPVAIVGAVLWFRALSYPVILDKTENVISYATRRESLTGARAVAVKVCTSSDSADHYEIEIVLSGRRVTVGCAGWTCETNRARADANAERIAAFLGLPVEAAAGS